MATSQLRQVWDAPGQWGSGAPSPERTASGAGDQAAGKVARVPPSQAGRYQLRSPSIAIAAGISTPRTMVASMSTAEAMPMPNILNSITDSVAKIENTATMITAALV